MRTSMLYSLAILMTYSISEKLFHGERQNINESGTTLFKAFTTSPLCHDHRILSSLCKPLCFHQVIHTNGLDDISEPPL